MSDSESLVAFEDSRSSTSPAPGTVKKRKRDAESNTKAEKTAKRKKKRKLGAVEDDDLDVDLGINKAVGRMDSSLVADYVAQRTKRFGGDLSLVELEDRHIPGRSFVAVVSIGWRGCRQRTHRLLRRCRKSLPGLKQLG